MGQKAVIPYLKGKERLYLLIIVALFAIAVLGLPYLPADVLRRYGWAFYHARDFPLPIRLLLAVIPMAACMSRINECVGRGLNHAIRFVSSKGLVQKGIVYSLIALLSFSAFYLLRDRNYDLGDSTHLIRAITFSVHTIGHHITYDEPLELYAHSLAYRILHRTLDWDAARSYALVSALCGVALVFITLSLATRFAEAAPQRWIVFGLIVSGGWIQLFFGHVENYTIVATGAALYILLAIAYLQGRSSIFWPALVLSISLCMHILAGWLFPSLLYLWVTRFRERSTKANLISLTLTAVGIILPIVLTLAWCVHLGYTLKDLKYTHAARLKFIPLLDVSYRYYQYPFFSFRHFIDALNEITLVALPGTIALLFVLLFHIRRINVRDRVLHFLIVVTVFLQIFAISWNPDLGAYRDWDVYAIIGLGYLPLAGYLLVHTVQDKYKLRTIGLILITLGLVHSATWIISNAGKHIPVNTRHDAAHLTLGNEAAKQGRLDLAIENYQEAVRANPNNPIAHMKLGEAYWRQGDPQQALQHFQEYLRLAPDGEYAERVRVKVNQLRGGSAP